MKVNFEERTISITRTIAKKASQYGSKEYQELVAVTRELPNFKVVIKPSPVRKAPYCNITYAFMEQYIACHDIDGSARAEFESLRHVGLNYAQVKKWFLNKFSNISSETALAA